MPNISYSLGWTNIKNLIDEKFYNQFFQNEIIRGIITLLVCFLFNLFLYIGISCFVLVLNCVFLLYTFYVLELCPLHFFNEIWLVIQKKKKKKKKKNLVLVLVQFHSGSMNKKRVVGDNIRFSGSSSYRLCNFRRT